MGRYYNSTNNHYSGKFGFGVQGSDAATKFGCVEQEPTTIIYYGDDAEAAKEGIDKCYDTLGVPQEERKYDFTKEKEKDDTREGDKSVNSKASWDYVDSLAKDYVFDRMRREDYHGDHIPYSTDQEGYVDVPKSDDKLSAYFDLGLGLMIYSEILAQGYAELEAEL